MDDIAIIAIGRNEGERLKRGLASIAGAGIPIIYVDSGSSDNSLGIAREAGAHIVELDMSVPFSAARARNVGAEAALALSPVPQFLQFIDGDCAIAVGWLDAAQNYLNDNPSVVLVTGWREEIDRNATVYNAMCDVEWHRPAGEIEECGGDLMVRSNAHQAIGGYNPVVIAGEDIDYCLRLDTQGKRVLLPVSMTHHDVAMTSFSQWWWRAMRAGHSYAHINDLYPGRSRREILRAFVYGLVLPIAAVTCLFVCRLALLGVIALYGLSYIKTAAGLVKNGQPIGESLHHAIYLSLSKFPNLLGITTYYRRKLQRSDMEIIEYK